MEIGSPPLYAVLQEAADTTETVPEEAPELVDDELNEEQKAQAEAIIARNRAAQAERNNNDESEENDQVGDLPEIERDAFRTFIFSWKNKFF